MKDTNLQAAAMTLAAQMTVRELKQKLRDEGCRANDPRMYGLGRAVVGYLREHPEIVERAEQMIAMHWRFAKFRSGAQRKAR